MLKSKAILSLIEKDKALKDVIKENELEGSDIEGVLIKRNAILSVAIKKMNSLEYCDCHLPSIFKAQKILHE